MEEFKKVSFLFEHDKTKIFKRCQNRNVIFESKLLGIMKYWMIDNIVRIVVQVQATVF